MYTIFLIVVIYSSISNITASHSCTNDFMRYASTRNIMRCVKLNSLGAEFGWNGDNNNNNNSNIANVSKIDMLFWAKMETEKGWVAWGVNPGKTAQMVGTRAIIGIKVANGSSTVDTYNVTRQIKIGFPLLPSKIEVGVENKGVFFDEEAKRLAIYATISLGKEYNVSKLNIVWQIGHTVEELKPEMHSVTLDYIDSTGTINLESEVILDSAVSRQHLRNVHGIMSITSWGTILPFSMMFSRYLKQYPFKCKYWFKFHVFTQCTSYTIGFSGWLIGLFLGNTSSHRTFLTHRILGICIFSFTTIQLFAIRLRPNSRDKYRKFWNMYHHFLGYSILTMVVVNIFKGIAILKPHTHKWEQAYIGVLGVLGSIALGFEILTWIKFFLQKKNSEHTPILAGTPDVQSKATPMT